MSNKPSGLRRAGRRKSTPASPTSPIFHRRSERSQDVLPPGDLLPNDSPSIDLTVPSPSFDLTPISPMPPSDTRPAQKPQTMNRASDDLGKNRPKFLSETMRPATSSAEGSGWGFLQQRSAHSPEPATSRESPSFGGRRISAEGSRGSSSREIQDGGPGPALRGYSFASQQDKNVNEEGTTAKGAGAKKSRFNLKSPMSLFNRRRSSQNTNKLDDGNVSISKLHVPAIPDNIETSIYGNIVHDFSKPRNRRSNNENSPRPAPIPSPSYPRRPSDLASLSSAPSGGSPMFKEHFQEEQRPVQPMNTAYLHSQSLQLPVTDALPSFAKRLPLDLPTGKDLPPSPQEECNTDEKQSDSVLDTTPSLPPEPEIPPPPPPTTPPVPENPSPVLDLPPTSALPKHMTSTSSRFSFQIGQQGSIAQEKFLEEKHKEQAARKPAAVRLSVALTDDGDDFDYENDIDDEDGFDNGDVEIRNVDMPSSQIPIQLSSATQNDYDEDDFGVGDDDEDDAFGTSDIVVRNIDVLTSGQGIQHDNYEGVNQESLREFNFTPQSLSFSPSTAQYTSMSTPRDFEGLAIGTAQSRGALTHDGQPQIRDSFNQSLDGTFVEGLGISTLPDELLGAKQAHQFTQTFDDLDLYYDDGEFGDNVVEFEGDFDESMLDDAEHIKDIPAENARKYEEALQRSSVGDRVKVVTHADDVQIIPKTPEHNLMRAESEASDSESRALAMSNQNGLTEGNLAAYHDALAMAATQAAANGKFDRNSSVGRRSDDETDSPFQNSIAALSSRGSKYSNKMMETGVFNEDGFDFDDDMDDDAMIAAANAEALENDDEGLYGQEFGFYARAHGRDTAEFSSGGYFTSRGSNGVKRSHSGKNNFQEPSLTPITERSERSNRNSVISLPLHSGISGGSQALASPGIAELIEEDSPIVDHEMDLNTLLKWRFRTFGGSSTSINSQGDRHHTHSSPLAHLSNYNVGASDGFAGRMSSPIPGMSGLSIAESEDEEDEWGRPTLTQNTPHKKHAEPVTQSSQEQLPSSPISRKGNHSRNSSGAESVSYARDTDGRWVLERRRTGDHGETELIEREYLPGARI